MKIAVSGTHYSGKTTLVEEFLLAHRDYAHEPEPYQVLVEDYGEEFSAEPCADDFFRQLQFSVERLSARSRDERVIFDRCPIDFFAYLLALSDLKREKFDPSLLETALALVLESLGNLDLVVFLPLDDRNIIELPDGENPKLRNATDAWLNAFYSDDDFTISTRCAGLVEARGTVAQRLAQLEQALNLPREAD
jgi:AAA domain-containing protein